MLALAAFVISITGTAIQLGAWMRGPEVNLFQPDGLVIYASDETGGAAYVRVVSTMSYANSAPAAYSGVVRRERATLTIGARSSAQIWSHFGKTNPKDGNHPTAESDAAPFPIAGGAGVSHGTIFAPAISPCLRTGPSCDGLGNILSVDELTTAISTRAKGRVTLTAELYPRGDIVRICDFDVSPNLMAQWNLNGWMSPACKPPPSFWSRAGAWLHGRAGAA